MNTIGIDQLEPNRFYWARRLTPEGAAISEANDIEVVQISTVFGSATEFWTVAVMASDEHFDLAAFEFFHKVPSPPISENRRPILTVISAPSRRLGN